jgi:hypothetical protein
MTTKAIKVFSNFAEFAAWDLCSETTVMDDGRVLSVVVQRALEDPIK